MNQNAVFAACYGGQLTQYVLGFAHWEGKFVLVRKTRGPEHNIGKWNGVGGKWEKGETAHEAMVREFREETGWDLPIWNQFGLVFGPGFMMPVFECEFPIEILPSTNDVGEVLTIARIADIDFKDLAQNVSPLTSHVLHGEGNLKIELQ